MSGRWTHSSSGAGRERLDLDLEDDEASSFRADRMVARDLDLQGRASQL